MITKRTYKRFGQIGFTLTELLIVLTIGAIIASVGVASYVQFTSSMSQETSRAARELYTILSAAKIYASTYRVNTAVAYNITTSGINEEKSINGFTLVRQVNKDAVNDAEYLEVNVRNSDQWFVPVEGRASLFTLLPNNVCIKQHMFQIIDPDTGETIDGRIYDEGLMPIKIFREEFKDPESDFSPLDQTMSLDGDVAGTIIGPNPYCYFIPDPNIDEEDVVADLHYYFPAHVFTPAGQIIAPRSSKERFEISIGPAPDMNTDLADLELEEIQALNVIVNLFRSTARVKIAS